jgi:hypothetical protein
VFEGTNRLQAGISNTNMLGLKKAGDDQGDGGAIHTDAAPKTQAQNLAGNLNLQGLVNDLRETSKEDRKT